MLRSPKLTDKQAIDKWVQHFSSSEPIRGECYLVWLMKLEDKSFDSTVTEDDVKSFAKQMKQYIKCDAGSILGKQIAESEKNLGMI